MIKKEKPRESAPPPENECWEAFHNEVNAWQEAKLPVRFFLRDDDAIDVTDKLDLLVKKCDDHNVPLLLATIPEPANHRLGLAYKNHELITAAVHGFAHTNHSPKGEKTCELGRHRPIETVLGELNDGRDKLFDMFDGNVSNLLVPPWNRIHDEVLAEIWKVGFKGVSAHAWLKTPAPLPMVNIHVDIIHWSGGKVGREHNWVLNQITENLKIARQKGRRAFGILTHHLDHDEKAWSMLDRLFEATSKHPNISWIPADDLISEPPEL